MAKLSTTKRGYGAHHQALRERLRPQVEAGEVLCARCGKIIEAGTPWDLGHVDGRVAGFTRVRNIESATARPRRTRRAASPASGEWVGGMHAGLGRRSPAPT
jgi:hypothetical protein